jgi:transposase
MQYELPKDYDELARDYRRLESRIDELEELIRLLRRGRFAASSEKLLHPGMVPLFHDEAEDPQAKADEQTSSEVKAHKRKSARKPLPESLPREEVYCDLPAHEKVCACCNEQMVKTHDKTSEKLHIKPAEFIVKKFIMPVYACKGCEQVKQAKMPAHPIPKCSVTIETLAYIAVAKYMDGLPLHRLEKIFAREGVELTRDKMARWLVILGERLLPLKVLLHKDLIAGGLLAMDETTIQVLKEKGRRPDQKSYLLAQAREGPPGNSITLFHYEKSRATDIVSQHLAGFEGSLITDGLAVYVSHTSLNPAISHGGCMAHARRKFTEVMKGKQRNTGIAKEALDIIAEIFALESKIKLLTLEEIHKERQEKSKPLFEKLEALWLKNIQLVPAKSLTGKALHYLKNQWTLLTRNLADPNLPIHNNYLERQIRPVAVGRKAWLFADTPEGAEATSVFYSLLNTAKENNLNPMEYLTKALSKIDQASEHRAILPYA